MSKIKRYLDDLMGPEVDLTNHSDLEEAKRRETQDGED